MEAIARAPVARQVRISCCGRRTVVGIEHGLAPQKAPERVEIVAVLPRNTTGKVLKNVTVLLKLATHKEATDLRTYEVEVVDNSVRLRV